MSWFQDMLDRFNRWWDGKEDEDKPVPPHAPITKEYVNGHWQPVKTNWAERVKLEPRPEFDRHM